MDILYTLGKGSTWQDNELRYSLRSIDKYGINVNRIYIVGDWCPGFVDRDKVTFIRCQQPYTDKFKNILYSVLYACENSDIAEDFLLSSDDHFYMKKTDFDNYPYWLKNLDLPDAYCLTGYKRHLFETRNLLERHGYEAHNYAQHCNTHFVKSVLLKHKDIIEESFSLFKGVEATCLMLNILMKDRPFKWKVRSDCKFREPDKKEIHERLKDIDCFSIADCVIPIIGPVLKKEFPKPCKYEKTYSCCVVVPIYKQRLSEGEERSVDQSFKVLGYHPFYFFAPETLDTTYYEQRYAGAVIKRFADEYFRSVDDYTRLLCTPQFYEAFAEWDYMLIDQPDCWVFRDEIDRFCALGYDYIGAPWPEGKKGVPKGGAVGNGGFCLRRIKVFIDISGRRVNTENHPEDWFYCVDCADDLNIAPPDIAAHFALELCPARIYYKYGGKLPMGCHKPQAYSYNKFWKGLGVPDLR